MGIPELLGSDPLDTRVLPHQEVVRLSRIFLAGEASQLEGQGQDERTRPLNEAGGVTAASRDAKNALIKHNLRLVLSIAKQYKVYGLEIEDHFQNGYIGLARAVEKFNPELGNQFSTYATWWIRQSIFRGIDNQSRIIRVPVHVLNEMRKIDKVKRYLTTFKGSAQILEISKILNIAPEKVKELMTLSSRPTSLDDVTGDGLTTLGDLIPSEKHDFTQFETAEIVEGALDSLTKREKEVISSRFGIKNNEIDTLENIGKKLGLTRERIRQIELIALQKLRENLNKSNKAAGYYGQSESKIYEQHKNHNLKVSTAKWNGTVQVISSLRKILTPRTNECIEVLVRSKFLNIEEFGSRMGYKSNGFTKWFTREMNLSCKIVGCATPVKISDGVISIAPRFSTIWLSTLD